MASGKKAEKGNPRPGITRDGISWLAAELLLRHALPSPNPKRYNLQAAV